MARETFAKILFDIYEALGTNPDKNSELIEAKLVELGFKIDVCADPFGRLCLLDVDNNNRDVHKNPM
jgi:hypothetical protein